MTQKQQGTDEKILKKVSNNLTKMFRIKKDDESIKEK